jgi:hypothetical protein
MHEARHEFDTVDEGASTNRDRHSDLESDSQSCGEILGTSKLWKTVVVGTGPGAAICVESRSHEGDLLAIEAGSPSPVQPDFHGVSQLMSSFKFGGQELIFGRGLIPFAQGEAVGGGGAVNSGLYHSLPEGLHTEWFPGVSSSKIRESAAHVEKLLRVEKQSSGSLGIYKESPLARIGHSSNLEGGVIPRWRAYEDSRQFEHHNAFQRVLAKAPQTSLLHGHRVISVNGRGKNLELHALGKKCSHVIMAENVVLAAGTLGTPELLVNSGLAQAKDFKFSFHPMIRVIAEFDTDVNDLRDIDPHQFWTKDLKYKFGAAVGTKELLSATMINQGINHQGRDLRKIGSYYVSFAPSGKSGLFRIGDRLYPYFLRDKKFDETARTGFALLRSSLSAVKGEVLSHKISLSTVHVFGSMPLRGSRVVDEDGSFREFRSGQLLVRDASLLPSPPLVNPQGPMMQLIHFLETEGRST